MLGKYQLNFVEQDQQDLFQKKSIEVEFKMNYISGTILLIIQLILLIKLQLFDKEGFHVVTVSVVVSVIALMMNKQYPKIASMMIFTQYILLNGQFISEIYQKYLEQLVKNKAELFLIGLGYGNLNQIVLSSFQKWQIRSICIWISCIFGFFWSKVDFESKLSYLLVLYLTSFFGVVVYFFQEKFQNENIDHFFQKNKSLMDWQKIIKQNIPQSMVFVTKPKKKSTPNSTSMFKKEIWNVLTGMKDTFFKSNKQNYSIKKQDDLKEDREGELVFNFVNKKFYDQFRIKDWVDKQKKVINNPSTRRSKFSKKDILLNDNSDISTNLVCTQSPIHQILFNSIFKNILVSTSEGGNSFNGFENSFQEEKQEETIQSLSEYLKSFILDQRSQTDCLQTNSNEEQQQASNLNSSDVNNQRESIHQLDLVKALSCFYRPSPPSNVIGNQTFDDLDPNNNESQSENPKSVKFQSKETSKFPTKIEDKDEESKKKSSHTNFVTMTTETENLVLRSERFEIGKECRLREEALVAQQVLSSRGNDTLVGQERRKNFLPFETERETGFLNIDVENKLKKGDDFESARRKSSCQKKVIVKELVKQPKGTDLNQIQIEIPISDKYPQETHIEIDEEDSIVTQNQAQDILKQQVKQPLNNVNSKKEKEQSNEQIKNLDYLNVKNKSSNNSNLEVEKKESKKLNFLQRIQTVVLDNAEFPEMQSISSQQQQQQKTSNIIQEGKISKLGASILLPQNQNILSFDRKNQSQNKKPQENKESQINEAFFFDTQMVSCLWGEEEGVLLILNDVSLKIINEKLREIERFKDKMLSTVTHDLKTPLNSIIMIMENSMEQKGGLGKKQRKIILQNSQMLMSLINDILDYSQIRRDKFRLIIEKIKITQIVLDVVDLFEMQAKQKRIRISAKFCNIQQEFMMQDERRIKQILVNLIGNALKFTQQEGKIDVIVKQKLPDCIQIAIKDNGTGISEQIQKKLFQFFNTFDHSEKANNRHGIGLGLAICKQLNSQMGPWHEIKLKSQINQGSKFTFCVYVNLLEHEGIKPIEQPMLASQKAVIDRQFSNHPSIDQFKKDILSNSTRRFEIHRSTEQEVKSKMIYSTNLYKQKSQDNVNEPSIILNPKQTFLKTFQTKLSSKISTPKLSKKNSLNDMDQIQLTSQNSMPAVPIIILGPQNQPLSQQVCTPELKISNLEKATSPHASPNLRSLPKDQSPACFKINSPRGQKQFLFQGMNSPSLKKNSSLKLQESTYYTTTIKPKSIKDNFIKTDVRKNGKKSLTLKQDPHYLSMKKAGLPKAFTVEHQQSDKKSNSLIVPFYSPSVPIPSKSYLQSQELIKNMGATSQTIQEGAVSQYFFGRTKSMRGQTGRESLYISKNKFPTKMKKSGMFNENKNGKASSQNAIESDEEEEQIKKLETVEEKDKLDIRYLSQSNEENSDEKISENFAEIEEFKKKNKNLQNLAFPIREEKNVNSILIPNESIAIPLYEPEIPHEHPWFEEKNLNVTQNNNNLRQVPSNASLNKTGTPKEETNFTNLNTLNNIGNLMTYNNTLLQITSNNNFNTLKNSNTTNISQSNSFPLASINQHLEEDIKKSNKEGEDKQISEQQENISIQKIQQQLQFSQKLEKSLQDYKNNKKSGFGIFHNHEEEEDEDEEEAQDVCHDNILEKIEGEEEDDEDEEEEEDDDEEEDEQEKENIQKQNNEEHQEATSMREVQNRAVQDRKQQSEMLKNLLEDYDKVLIADDSPFNIFCLQQVLGKNKRLQIHVAYNGSEALNSYKTNLEQIIFMDLNMPVLDGNECMKCIRQFEDEVDCERTKIIIISAQEYEPFFSDFDGFLSKPIKLLDIINLLEMFRENNQPHSTLNLNE